MSEVKPRTYGPSWSQRLEDPARCVESVHERGRGVCSYQCAKKRGFGPNGEYCKTHDPAYRKAQDDKRQAKWDAESKRNKQQWDDRRVGNWLRENDLTHYERILKGAK